MTSLRDQEKLDRRRQRRSSSTSCNFSKPPAASRRCSRSTTRARCSTSSATALHGLLSNVTYPLLSGTSVPSDFVELPSQLYEHWLERAGDPAAIRAALQNRRADAEGAARQAAGRRAPSARALPRSSTSPARWSISTSTRCRQPTTLDVAAFEREALERIGMPAEIVMRHRPPHFAACVLRRRLRGGLLLATCGRKCSTPTRSRRSRRPATCSIRRRAQRLRDNIYGAGGSARSGRGLHGVPRPAADARMRC